eukprot:scaffold12976_cov197-Amphora_coffeaeformis.AAC.6
MVIFLHLKGLKRNLGGPSVPCEALKAIELFSSSYNRKYYIGLTCESPARLQVRHALTHD